MTKRTKPKAIPVIATQAPTEGTESVTVEGKAKVVSKPKQANTTAKKASTAKPRGRPKKVKVVDKPTEAVDRLVRKAADVGSPIIITYVDPVVMAVKQEPEPSLYDRFVGWLFRITYNFRGY